MNNKLQIAVQKAKLAGYNEEEKAEYKRLALSYLRELAKKLELPRGSYNIRFNPGGIAVSGDAIFHHDKFYFVISECGAMWRRCKGQKDYTGGQNLWLCGFGFNFADNDVIGTISNYLRLI